MRSRVCICRADASETDRCARGIALDGRVVDDALRVRDLSVGPGMVWLGETVPDPVALADHVELHWPVIDAVPVPGGSAN